MFHYIKITQILYICFALIFCIFIFFLARSGDTILPDHMLYIFLLLLLPLFDSILESMNIKNIFDGRIFFLIALGLFCYIGLFLIIGANTMAENYAVYAYYFLILGVIVEIAQNIWKRKFGS